VRNPIFIIFFRLIIYFSGGDCHVATDGNFHHRHLSRAGDSPSFYEPDYFISKAQMDAVGDRIEHARQRPSCVYKAKVPDTAIDDCQDSHEAADGRKEKTSGEQFDDRGLAALVCRHDIAVFFFANIDSLVNSRNMVSPSLSIFIASSQKLLRLLSFTMLDVFWIEALNW
jgi:hypothetical protein